MLTVDHPHVFESMNNEDDEVVATSSLTHVHKERLSCLDHTPYLVVGDGLKESRCVSTSLAKSCKLASMLHTSSSFKDAFENAFDPNTCISAAVATRWNSTLRQIKSILALDAKQLDAKQLTDLLESQGLKHLTFSARVSGSFGSSLEAIIIIKKSYTKYNKLKETHRK